MQNPFKFGRELGAADLLDREEEVRAVQRAIREGGKLFLVGPRRFGKTSILKAAGEQLTKGGKAVVLRYNAEAFPGLDLLVRAIVADAAAHLRGGVSRAGDQVKQFFKRLRPEVNFNVTEQTWSATLGAASPDAEDTRQTGLLVEALNGLEGMASQASPRPFGLMIDEFQRLIELGGQEAEGQLRAAIQQHQHVGYVFAGSKTRMLTDMITQASRPFYRLGTMRFVGPIPRADFLPFLRTRFEAGDFKVTERSLGLVLEAAEDVPYNIQLLAHTCWDDLNSGRQRLLTAEVVTNALERIVREYDPFYTQLWGQLTPIQQKVLIAAIQEKGLGLQSMKVARAVGKGPATLRRALEALVARDILRQEEKLGEVRYRLEDPFFGQWVKLFAAGL